MRRVRQLDHERYNTGLNARPRDLHWRSSTCLYVLISSTESNNNLHRIRSSRGPQQCSEFVPVEVNPHNDPASQWRTRYLSIAGRCR